MLKLKQSGALMIMAATISIGGMIFTAEASTPPAGELGAVVHDNYTGDYPYIAKQFRADLIDHEMKYIEQNKSPLL